MKKLLLCITIAALSMSVQANEVSVDDLLVGGLAIESPKQDARLGDLFDSLDKQVGRLYQDQLEAEDFCEGKGKEAQSHKRHPGGALEVVCE